jgi:hypothetical protein
MTTTIATCSCCGLNVPTPTITYSRDGDLLCRNCSDRDGMMQTIGRARHAANSRDVGNGDGGILGLIVSIPALIMHGQIDRIENQVAREVTFNAANAQAVSFTCKPCGKELPLKEGTYNPGHRLLCKTCFAADAEKWRKAYRKQLMVQRALLLILAVVVLFVIGMAIGPLLKAQ